MDVEHRPADPPLEALEAVGDAHRHRLAHLDDVVTVHVDEAEDGNAAGGERHAPVVFEEVEVEVSLALPVVVVVLEHARTHDIEEVLDAAVLRVGGELGRVVGVDRLVLAPHVAEAREARGLAPVAEVVADDGLFILQRVGGPGRYTVHEQVDPGLLRLGEIRQAALEAVEVGLLHGDEEVLQPDARAHPARAQEGDQRRHTEGARQGLAHLFLEGADAENFAGALLGMDLQALELAAGVGHLDPEAIFGVDPEGDIPVEGPAGKYADPLAGRGDEHRAQRVDQGVDAGFLFRQVREISSPEAGEAGLALACGEVGLGLLDGALDGGRALVGRPGLDLPLRNLLLLGLGDRLE